MLDDPLGVELYRDVMERVWPEDGALPEVPIDEYRLILEHLDATPPGIAAELGRWIQSKRKHLSTHTSWASGVFRNDEYLTVYACDHADNYEDTDQFTAELATLMATRGSEALEQGLQVTQTAAVGVLQGDSWLDYRFAFAAPPLDLPRQLRFEMEERYGRFDADAERVRPLEKGRPQRTMPMRHRPKVQALPRCELRNAQPTVGDTAGRRGVRRWVPFGVT